VKGIDEVGIRNLEEDEFSETRHGTVEKNIDQGIDIPFCLGASSRVLESWIL
jgi:hypothetical protein